MWPKRIWDWKHVDFDAPLPTQEERDAKLEKRKEAHLRTRHELHKCPQQFISDVIEEAERAATVHKDMKLTYGEHLIIDHLARLATQNKRITALHAISAVESGRTNFILLVLTLVSTALAIFLGCQEIKENAATQARSEFAAPIVREAVK
jgi:hypothetical protein